MRYSGIGGQAVMEGVMMKNQEKYAVAVRKPDGEIALEVSEYKGIIKIPEVNKILPLHITEKGILLVGDYKDCSITSFNLNKYGSI